METQHNDANDIAHNVSKHIRATLAEQQTTTDSSSDNLHPPSTLQIWKNQVLSRILWITLLLNLPLIMGDLIKSFQQHKYVLFTIIFVWITAFAIITVVSKIGFTVRVTVFLFLIYFSATTWLTLNGLIGTGRILFILLLVSAALLLDYRRAIMVWIGSLLTIAIVFGTFANGIVSVSPTLVHQMHAPIFLTTGWFLYTIITIPIVTSVILVVNRLQNSIQQLEASQTKLRHINATLEKQVAERTEELRQNQALLQSVLDHVPSIIFAQDDQLRYIVYSEYARTKYGLDVKNVIGKTSYDVLSHTVALQAEKTHRQVWQTKQYMELENTVDVDGEQRTFMTIKFPILNDDGSVFAVGGISTDITQRKKSHQTLQQANMQLTEAYRNLVEHSLQGLVIIQDRRYIFANQTMSQITGYTVDELLAMSPEEFKKIIHPDDFKQTLSYYERRILGEDVSNRYEHRFIHKDGNIRWVEAYITLTSYQGKLATQGAYVDITQRKQSELSVQSALAKLDRRIAERTEELRKSQALLQGVLDYSTAIIFVQDAKQRYLMINHHALDLYGVAVEDVIGKTPDVLMPPHVVTKWKELHHHVWHKRHHIEYEDTIEIKGQQRTFLTAMFPIRNSDGTMFAVGGIATDITQRKQMEDDLHQAKEIAEQATRTKSEFLANMSHEIRTPMNAVIGMTNLLLDTPLTQEQRDYTETIRISGDALLTIINDILDFSKIEAGKLSLEQHPFKLRTCIEEALELLAPRAAEKNVPLMYWMDADVPEHLIGDITRVRQIIVNLLSNAVKFTEEGEIVVSVSVDNRPETGDTSHLTPRTSHLAPRTCPQIHLSVRDSGIGISPEAMQRLFKSFSQADTSTTRKYGGTGLGLTICKRLAEMMGGTIWVESETGVGSTFHITFSAEVQPDQTDMPSMHQQHPALAGKHVLIVDDNATNSTILSRYATTWGMEPHVASSSEAALDSIAQGQQVDVVVLSISKPCIVGPQLAKKLYKDAHTQHIPVILYFCAVCRNQIEPKLTKNIAAWLTRPVRPQMLFDAMLDVFDADNHLRTASSRQGQFDESMATQHPLRILLAEDNVVNQKVALHMLAKMGYRTDVAANGREVLEALRRKQYDVVLMDVQMPEMDGVEATKHIRTIIPREQQPRIVAMTAHALQGNREWLLEAGMDEYVSKPVQINQFVTVLQTCQPLPGSTLLLPAPSPSVYGGHLIDSPMPPASQDKASTEVDIEPPSRQEHQHRAPPSTPVYGGEMPDSPLRAGGLGGETSAVESEAPTLDRDILDDMYAMMGYDIAEELIQLYLADTPVLIESMQQSYAQGKNEEFTRAAHSLKSSSAQVGAMRLSKMCKELESYGKQGITGPAVAALLAQAAEEFARVQNHLKTTQSSRP